MALAPSLLMAAEAACSAARTFGIPRLGALVESHLCKRERVLCLQLFFFLYVFCVGPVCVTLLVPCVAYRSDDNQQRSPACYFCRNVAAAPGTVVPPPPIHYPMVVHGWLRACLCTLT